MRPDSESIAAVVLAAGQSQRMGQPKMILPWKSSTVIRTVVNTLESAGFKEIIVVTGGAEPEVKHCLAGSRARPVYNPAFENGEMLDSIQVGLQAIPEGFQAALVALGDQPQIETSTVTALLEVYSEFRALIYLPSYQMRRGHPWLLRRKIWPELLALHHPETMRDFFRTKESQIRYVEVITASILEDLDTPEDYRKSVSSSTSHSEKK